MGGKATKRTANTYKTTDEYETEIQELKDNLEANSNELQ